MSEIKSQFFNGKTYSATDFVESNKNTMKDGILPNTDFFKVLPASNMTIGVTSGRGWVQGHAFSSDGTLSFTLDNADGVLDRIDTVIIRLDLTTDNEKIECKLVKGALGGSAAAPVRNGTYYDLVIAHITVAHGITAITSAMITDKRGDGNLCGWSGAISGDQFNFDEKANKTYCDDTFTTKAALTAYQLTITNGTTKANADRLQGKAISATAPTTGQVLQFNGTSYTPVSIGSAELILNATPQSVGNVNYSSPASNYKYLCYYVEPIDAITYNGPEWHAVNSGMQGIIPVGILPIKVSTINANYYRDTTYNNIETYATTLGDYTFSSMDVYVNATNKNIKVWGVK